MNQTTIVKKQDEKPLCSHYKNEGHVVAKCWKIHPELRSKGFGNNKGNKNTMALIQHYLGLDLRDEIKITTMGIQGMSIFLVLLLILIH